MNIIERGLEKAEEVADAIWKKMYQPEEKGEEEKPVETKEETPSEEVVSEEPLKGKPETSTEPEKEVDYKQKYKTLEGKYKAELPRANEERDRLKVRTNELEAKITELQGKIEKGHTEEKGKEIDAELEELAIDYPTVAKALQKLKEGTEAQLKSVKDELQTGVRTELDTVKSDLVSTKLVSFDAEMKGLGVPDWKEIDNDPKFVEWLGDTVPYTKSTKLELLKSAAKERDAKTVSQFFIDYKKSLEVATEETPEPDSQDKLKKFVAPPKGKGGTAPKMPGEQMNLTRANYEKFMDETSRGKFNPAKWGGKTEDQVDAMFDAAIAAGKLL